MVWAQRIIIISGPDRYRYQACELFVEFNISDLLKAYQFCIILYLISNLVVKKSFEPIIWTKGVN